VKEHTVLSWDEERQAFTRLFRVLSKALRYEGALMRMSYDDFFVLADMADSPRTAWGKQRALKKLLRYVLSHNTPCPGLIITWGEEEFMVRVITLKRGPP
jgi:hypothetical protein